MPSDKQTKKDQRAIDRDEVLSIQKSFKMNLDDAFTKISNQYKYGSANGYTQSHAPSGLVDPNVARRERMIEEGILKAEGPSSQHIDWDGMLMTVKPGMKKSASATNRPEAAVALQQRFTGQSGQPTYPANNTLNISLANRIAEKYAPIINELSRFKFAASEDKRNEQMAELLGGLKMAMRKLAVRQVGNNTKALYENAQKFFQTESGIRVVYKVANGSNVSISVDGEFSGDEIICCEEDGANVTSYVARQEADGIQDLTQNYKIKMELV